MPQEFLTAERGVMAEDIENSYIEAGFVPSNGQPGTSQATNDAPKGSLAMDYTNGLLYQKINAGTGTDKWERMAKISDVTTGISWREPSEVRDNVSTTLPTSTPGTTITVDGETIADQERVLFSNLSPGNKNIYIYQQSTGTFTEDGNAASEGDATYIQRGTDAGKVYVFNGTDWVLINESSVTEIGYIQNYIGKPGDGNILPQYSSNNHVTDDEDLTSAISTLDAQIGPELTAGNIITAGQSTNDAIQDIDAALGALSGTIRVDGVTTITTLDAVLVDDVAAVEWRVTARQGANVLSGVVFAHHNGIDGGADANEVDWVVTQKLKNGTITGAQLSVDLNGAGTAQEMRLRGTATNATDFILTAERIVF